MIRARYVAVLFYKELLRFLANPALIILLLLFFCLGLLISLSDVILQHHTTIVLEQGELPGFLEYADRIEPDLSIYTSAQARVRGGAKRRVRLRLCSDDFEERLRNGNGPCLEIASSELSQTELGRLRDLLIKDSFLYLKVRVPLEVRIAVPGGESSSPTVPDVGLEPLEEPEDLKRLIMALLITISLNIITFNLFTVTLAEEKQNRTLLAILLSPAHGAEVAVAKGIFFLIPGLGLGAALTGVYRPDLLAEPVFWATLISGAVLYMSMSLVLVSFVEKQSTASLICLGYLFFLTSMFILAPRFTALYPIKNHMPENFIFSVLSFLLDGTPFPVYQTFFLSFLAVALAAPAIALTVFGRRMTSRPPPLPAAERRWSIGDAALILVFCLLFQFVIMPAIISLVRSLPMLAGHKMAAVLIIYMSLFAIPLALVLPVYTRRKFGKSLYRTFLQSPAPLRHLLAGLLWFGVYLAALLLIGMMLHAVRLPGLPPDALAAFEKLNPRAAHFFRVTLGLLHGLGPGSLFLFVLVIGIVVPVFEEMYFRGCLLTALEQRWGPRVALGVSALAFGLFHLNLVLLPLYCLVGILTGLLYQRQKSLLSPIVFHISNNLFSLAVIAAVL